MRTRVTEMFGIDLPILAFSHCRDVVAAVSKAGGIGVLGALAFSPEQLEMELNWLDNNTGGKPYGVDIVIPKKYVGRSEGDFKKEDLENMISQEHKEWIEKKHHMLKSGSLGVKNIKTHRSQWFD